jgi:hypothetical protein
MSRLAKIEELGSKCSLLLSDYHFWKNLNSFILLMEEFLDKKISGKEFETRFYKMHAADGYRIPEWEELLYVIKNFKVIDFEDLTDLISDLLINCDSFEANPALRNEDNLTEEDLRNCVCEILFL